MGKKKGANDGGAAERRKDGGKGKKPAAAEDEDFGFDGGGDWSDENNEPEPEKKKKPKAAAQPVQKRAKAPKNDGGEPPAYQPRASVKFKQDAGLKKKPPQDLSDSNTPAALMSEDIRCKDRELGFKTSIGKGDEGGKLGGMAGVSSTVMQPTSDARPTLITQQPGHARTQDTFVPYVTPKPADKAGHIIFCMDIPKPAGPGGQIFSNDVERVMINRTKGTMGAQVCIETYSAGVTAEKGHTNDSGEWVPPSKTAGITREIIDVKSFNISEVQMVHITLTSASTRAEKQISIDTDIDIEEIHHPEIPKIPAVKEIPFIADKTEYDAKCGIACVDDTEPVCCMVFGKDLCYEQCWDERLIPGQLFVAKVPQVDAIPAWVEKIEHKKEHSKEKMDPFDVCSVTTIALTMRGNLQNFAFSWRIQSVGETETDLQYQLADELKDTCQDPTSTARTFANVVHYLNDK